MDPNITKKVDQLIDTTIQAMTDEFFFSEIWTSFFEDLDPQKEFDIDSLFTDFVSHTIASILLHETINEDPCSEIEEVGKSYLMPIERMMREFDCIEDSFAEELGDFDDYNDCADYYYEYSAFLNDSDCFQLMVDKISKKVMEKNPSRSSFEERLDELKIDE